MSGIGFIHQGSEEELLFYDYMVMLLHWRNSLELSELTGRPLFLNLDCRAVSVLPDTSVAGQWVQNTQNSRLVP